MVRRRIFDRVFGRAPASTILVFLLVGTFAFFPLIPQGKAQSVSTPIGRATIYGGTTFTSSQISFIAAHFTLLVTDFGIDVSGLQAIKTANANMKIIGYRDLIGVSPGMDDWAVVNSNENWFVHDASGNRIMDTEFGWYLMDVSSAGWRQHFVSHLNNLVNNAAFDGVFLDDCWPTIASWRGLSTFPSQSIINAWHQNTLGFLQYIKANLLSGKIVVINDALDTDFLNAVDGEMYEGFAHASFQDLNTYGSSILGALSGLPQDVATGKIVWCSSGTKYPGPTPPNATIQNQISAVLTYCYTAFLLIWNGAQDYFSFSASGDGSNGYYSIMDTNIGQPTDAFYSSQNVYMRDFTGGLVLFNPNAISETVNLSQTYTDLEGNTVTSLIMQPYTGDVLVPVSSAPPSTGSTFGKTTVGSLADVNSRPTLQAQRFQLTENGKVSKLTVYVGGQSSTCNIVGVIYADNAGVPSTLVAQTPITNVAGAAGWYNLTFSSPVSLTAGYYHLGWLSGASTTLTTYYDAGGTHTWNTGLQASAPFYPTPPNTFVVERQNAYTFSIYATYTPTAGSTFGKTTVGSLADVNSRPTLQAQRFQLTENGKVSKLTVYVGGQSSPCNIVGVIYADNAGVPSTLVAQTPITNVAGAAGWYNLTFSSPVSLTAGYYHLGWLSGASTTLTTYYDAGGTHTWNTGLQASAPFYPTPPNTFVVERQNAYTFSIYATYTPTA